MAFLARKKGAVTAAATTVIGTISLGQGARWGRVWKIIARNWASSAKAGAGTDTAQKIQLKDGDGKIFYLDAADRDYATAEVRLNFNRDTTATGLTDGTFVDATGAAWAVAAEQTTLPFPVKSPIEVSVLNAGTATDFFEVTLVVEV